MCFFFFNISGTVQLNSYIRHIQSPTRCDCFSLLLFNTLHVSGFAHPQEYMKLFVQPYVKVMLYLGGPMLLSSAVLWFVYLWNLVHLGILVIFSVVIGYIPVCGCALLLLCGVNIGYYR